MSILGGLFKPLFGPRADSANRLVRDQSGYSGATQGRRLRGYPGTNRGINSLILGDGAQLRARSRKAAIDNPWVVSAIRGFKADAIGDGIKPHFQHKRKATRSKLTELWDRWADEADSSFDPQSRKGLRNIYGQQMHVAGEVMEAGEAFARLRARRLSDGLTVPLQIQLIDPEQVPYYKQDGGAGDNIVRGGIEFDAIGRRVAYHMYRNHPGDNAVWPNSFEITRVPGDQVLHVFEPIQANPIRGVTWLASLLIKLEDLRQYDDATVLRNKMSAFFVGWHIPANPNGQEFSGEVETTSGTDSAPDGVAFADVEAGTIIENDPGESFGWNDPPDVGTQYETFMRVQLRAIARVLMRAYHQLTGDVSDTSFSSIRADLVNIRRELQQFQFQVICFQYCEPVLKAWLDAAALAGLIDAEDYAKNQWQYLNIEWRTSRWAWVDPLKDIQAEVMMNRAGYKPRSATILEMGYDPEKVDEQYIVDQQRADDLGLVFDSDGRRPGGKGATDVSPDAEEAGRNKTNPSGTGRTKQKEVVQ